MAMMSFIFGVERRRSNVESLNAAAPVTGTTTFDLRLRLKKKYPGLGGRADAAGHGVSAGQSRAEVLSLEIL
jgi:hypothetical protein